VVTSLSLPNFSKIVIKGDMDYTIQFCVFIIIVLDSYCISSKLTFFLFCFIDIHSKDEPSKINQLNFKWFILCVVLVCTYWQYIHVLLIYNQNYEHDYLFTDRC
jgi:heme/copper-type cytochrome/quinol oxidase subunit 4